MVINFYYISGMKKIMLVFLFSLTFVLGNAAVKDFTCKSEKKICLVKTIDNDVVVINATSIEALNVATINFEKRSSLSKKSVFTKTLLVQQNLRYCEKLNSPLLFERMRLIQTLPRNI